MPLRHIALPSWPLSPLPRFPSYALATRVQTRLQQELLSWKAQPPSSRGPPPPPTLLSFTPAPTYTLGRRQTSPLTARELARLRAPLTLEIPSLSPSSSAHSDSDSGSAVSRSVPVFFTPAVMHAPRGGLATYHGPGQVVFWPVVDLRSPLHAHFTVREYACLLEKTTIAALGALRGGEKKNKIVGFTTANPGVWVRRRRRRRNHLAPDNSEGAVEASRSGGDTAGDAEVEAEERKIAALGVHLRRHVTGLGVAINYATPVSGPEDVNPWGRIVACGLGDKGVTSVREEEGDLRQLSREEGEEEDDDAVAMRRMADTWAREFARRLEMHHHDLRGDGPLPGGVEGDVRREELDDGWVLKLGFDVGGDDGDGDGGDGGAYYVEARRTT